MHNFGVMAQVLLIGENRFLSPCDFKEVRRCKTVTFDNFCAISLATALQHHSANQFLKAATNLNVVQPKLFQASRQDDLRFSDCTVSVIKFLTMQMQPSAFWAGDGGPFYPCPPCLQTSRTASTDECA